MKKIIYFIGPGRSGSTILSIALSNHKEIAYFGELASFWSLKGEPRDGSEKNNAFWKSIIQKNEKLKKVYNQDFHKFYEHHYAFLKKKLYFGNKSEYVTLNRELYRALFSATKKNVLIDSSHYPLRAFWINKMNNEFEVYFIYLIKNPIDVIKSFQKKGIEQNYKSVVSANLYYFFVSTLTAIFMLFISRKRKLILRFEDFLKYPDTIIKKILLFINCSSDVNLDYNNLNVPEFIFDGNRLRKNSYIKLLQNKKSNSSLGIIALIFTYIVQGPFILLWKLVKLK